MNSPKFLLAGEKAVSVEFGNKIDPEINKLISAFNSALKQADIEGIIETVPSYRSIMVHYLPEKIGYEDLISALNNIVSSIDISNIAPATVIEIPVLYSIETGPDLEFVAAHNNKTIEQVIEIHTSTDYLIYMLGFTPGFPFLGGMSKEIATPRLQSPRVKIEGGSVGIAGEQTGVYPMDSPGGWQLIGKTPVKLYDPTREKPILLTAGEYVRFVSIDREEYDLISAYVDKGSYTCKTYPKEGV